MLIIESSATGPSLMLSDDEVVIDYIRAQGAGGQNVNKVSSAAHLRFDIHRSSLPEHYKAGLLALGDRRISKEGVLVIKAQRFRTQEKNREDALERLRVLIVQAGFQPKARRPTKPSKTARARRVDDKTKRGQIKQHRGRVDY